jgi:hypothetical protein
MGRHPVQRPTGDRALAAADFSAAVDVSQVTCVHTRGAYGSIVNATATPNAGTPAEGGSAKIDGPSQTIWLTIFSKPPGEGQARPPMRHQQCHI